MFIYWIVGLWALVAGRIRITSNARLEGSTARGYGLALIASSLGIPVVSQGVTAVGARMGLGFIPIILILYAILGGWAYLLAMGFLQKEHRKVASTFE